MGAGEPATDLVVHRSGQPAAAAPTMVFLHGLTDSGRGWPEAERHWGERFHIVAFDARGHGESPRFTPEELDGHPGDVMVDDAERLLEQLDRPVPDRPVPDRPVLDRPVLDRPVLGRPVLVGHSLGGAVALAVGVRRPDLVRALVLEDPAPLGPDEPLRGVRGAEWVAELEPSLQAADEDELREVRRAQHPGWPASELVVTGRAEQQVDRDYLSRGEFKPTTPWPELVAAVTVPTLVVSGDPDDPSTCVDLSMEEGIAAIANPAVTVVRVSGAGHCVRRDRPVDFYAAVDAWLANGLANRLATGTANGLATGMATGMATGPRSE